MFFIEDFLKHLKERQYRFSTLQDYRRTLEHFKCHFIAHGIEDVRDIPGQKILDYLNRLNQKTRPSKATCNRNIRIIKYFRYLEADGIIFLSPLRNYAIPKYRSKNHPVIGKGEMEKILRHTNTKGTLGIKGKAIIELAYSSALRPREIYDLRIQDIDFTHGLLFIEQSKNRKDRIVPVGTAALEWTKKYIQEVRPRYIKDKEHGYVFINHKSGEKLTVWGVRWAIQESLRRSGFEPIKTYSLRSTAATHLLVNGMNVVYISRLLGHSRITTTRHYLNIDLKSLKREIAAKHPRQMMEEYLKTKEESHEV